MARPRRKKVRMARIDPSYAKLRKRVKEYFQFSNYYAADAYISKVFEQLDFEEPKRRKDERNFVKDGIYGGGFV